MTAAAALIAACPLEALSVTEFLKYPPNARATFLSGALTMLAYSYAANGDIEKATCIKTWHLGKPGRESRSAQELSVEIDLAAKRDPNHLAIEGIVLGLAEKTCPGVKTVTK
jgi:hypothetical protein